ncbi:MAG: hypothetical protein M1823_000515 [Watsoniomyces obsoletus]|nr:MAG: hypothetical protein M1823_000515 [Watsoniomyces obsoletus]
MPLTKIPGLHPDQDKDGPGFVYKPCIGELIRTSYHPPNLVLLVVKIEIEPASGGGDEGNEAFRLFLSDNEYIIQAIILKETYRFVTTRETTEGSYIMLDSYEVQTRPRVDGTGPVAGLLRYLAITNFHTVGHCPDYAEMLEEAQEKARLAATLGSSIMEKNDKGYGSSPDGASPTKKRKVANSAVRRVIAPVKKDGDRKNQPVQGGQDQKLAAVKMRMQQQRGESDKENTLSKAAAVSIPPPRNILPKAGGMPTPVTPPKLHNNPLNFKPGIMTTPGKHPPFMASPQVPNLPLKPIPRPLEKEAITLSCIPSLQPRQNRLCDVLAIIDWVCPNVQSCFLGPKREVRLVDDSTDKRVLLSVFINPTEFKPEIGTVALWRNLRNHKWEGYSLNAYDKDCNGWKWFVMGEDLEKEGEKVGLEKRRVEELRKWWEKRCEMEREEKEKEKDGVKEEVGKNGEQEEEGGKEEMKIPPKI